MLQCSMRSEVTFAILGYGGRGREFAGIAKKPELFTRIVAVAEPDESRRNRAARELNLPPERVFKTAQELLAQPRMADAIINTTQDRLHAPTSLPAMDKGYHLLLEKPMAVTWADCAAIEAKQRQTGVMLAVCHSLRHNPGFATVKRILDSGALGEPVSFDQLEQIGDVHFSSSYVRGLWRNEGQSTFMLMAKCCHDLDLFHYLFGRQCRRVASFGSLTYFKDANKPAGAPERCLDGCPATACPYHAAKVYLESAFWREIVFSKQDDATILAALRTGPYGKCVFQTDNNVADHQVVALEYEGGLTGTFTATAFAPGGRQIRIHGTKGYLEGQIDQGLISLYDFATCNRQTIKVAPLEGTHGGGDYLIFRNFSAAIRQQDPALILTSAKASLESHQIVFAAEQSRREHRVVELKPE